MYGEGELSLRLGGNFRSGVAWCAVGAVVGIALAVFGGGRGGAWPMVAFVSGVTGVCLAVAFPCLAVFFLRRLHAGPDGLRMRRFLRWRHLAWEEIARFGTEVRRSGRSRRCHIVAELQSGGTVRLPLPYEYFPASDGFARTLEQLSVLRRRYLSL